MFYCCCWLLLPWMVSPCKESSRNFAAWWRLKADLVATDQKKFQISAENMKQKVGHVTWSETFLRSTLPCRPSWVATPLILLRHVRWSRRTFCSSLLIQWNWHKSFATWQSVIIPTNHQLESGNSNSIISPMRSHTNPPPLLLPIASTFWSQEQGRLFNPWSHAQKLKAAVMISVANPHCSMLSTARTWAQGWFIYILWVVILHTAPFKQLVWCSSYHSSVVILRKKVV